MVSIVLSTTFDVVDGKTMDSYDLCITVFSTIVWLLKVGPIVASKVSTVPIF